MREKPRHGIKQILAAIMPAEIPSGIQAYPQDGRVGKFTIIPTPGHTPGHVSLLYQDVLFCGDLVAHFNGRIVPSIGLITWDKTALLESIEKLKSYSFRWICPDHGSPLQSESLWDEFLEKYVLEHRVISE